MNLERSARIQEDGPRGLNPELSPGIRTQIALRLPRRPLLHPVSPVSFRGEMRSLEVLATPYRRPGRVRSSRRSPDAWLLHSRRDRRVSECARWSAPRSGPERSHCHRDGCRAVTSDGSGWFSGWRRRSPSIRATLARGWSSGSRRDPVTLFGAAGMYNSVERTEPDLPLGLLPLLRRDDYSFEVLVTDVVGDMAYAIGYERFRSQVGLSSR